MSGEDSVIDPFMLDLFRGELETQARALESGLVELEREPSEKKIEAMMRAAHSIKGAARLVGLDGVVGMAHAMEDVLLSAMNDGFGIATAKVDVLLQGTDVFLRMAAQETSEMASWTAQQAPLIQQVEERLRARPSRGVEFSQAQESARVASAQQGGQQQDAPVAAGVARTETVDTQGVEGKVVRVTADHLSRIAGFAGECLVGARSLRDQVAGLSELRRVHAELLVSGGSEATTVSGLQTWQEQFSERIAELEAFSWGLEQTADSLFERVLDSRMRPFDEGVGAFPRMVRDLAQRLGKSARVSIRGQSVKVDREILQKIEAPLTHLVRNAIDHGIESAADRERMGKPSEGTVTVEARHWAGKLCVSVSDDGAGLDPELIRQTVVRRGLVPVELAAGLSKHELMQFLFVPGFSTAREVTEVSGRGVGLDVVHTSVVEVGGTIEVDTTPGQGMSFRLVLPVTRSVLRVLLVEVASEPYALPLTRIDRVLMLLQSDLETVEGTAYYRAGAESLGLVHANQALDLPSSALGERFWVVAISDRSARYGLIVDRLLGERDLAIKALDDRFGKIPNVTAGGILEDGSPVLVLDCDDLVRSIDAIVRQGKLDKLGSSPEAVRRTKKRILVVDDSVTVREVERRLLVNRGYDVDVAVDGVDGWNAVRMGGYDLVVSDVDMPRMNGIDLVSQIKQDPVLRRTLVVIVSYKDREEDRLRGLEVGADAYLAKSGFRDDALVEAVVHLIGEP